MFFRQKTEHRGGGSGAHGDMELMIMMTPKIIRAAKPVKPEELSGKVQAALVAKGPQAQVEAELLSYTKRVRDEIVKCLSKNISEWNKNVEQ